MSNPVIKFENVSKKYKLYSKGGLYLRDRITHALQRLNPFNGTAGHGARSIAQTADSSSADALRSAPGALHPLERDFWALKDVSFEIKQGESVGFIGRNGAGKSTILKLLAGVTKPSSGQVEVSGRVAALIEVGAGFHPELTGRENIYLNGSILGMRKAEIEKQFESIVGFAELEQFIDTPVKHYSSGMYVRLGFAVAAHIRPDLFLIDEVLAVGDEAFQQKCMDVLNAHRSAGKTMILVSHQLARIQEICDRCIYIQNGHIEFDGTVDEAIARYRNNTRRNPHRQSALANEPADGQRKAEIVAIHVYDANGRESQNFKGGDDVVVEIRFCAAQRIATPAFGLAIYGPNNQLITCFDTKKNGLKAEPIEAEGSVSCRLKNLPLLSGFYQISAWLHDFDTGESYDQKPYCGSFRMVCENNQDLGFLNVKREWTGGARFHANVEPELELVQSESRVK